LFGPRITLPPDPVDASNRQIAKMMINQNAGQSRFLFQTAASGPKSWIKASVGRPSTKVRGSIAPTHCPMWRGAKIVDEGNMRSSIATEVWQHIKAAYATFGLREIARKHMRRRAAEPLAFGNSSV